MQVEQLEILDFLRAHPPFDALPEEVLQRVAAAVDVRDASPCHGVFHRPVQIVLDEQRPLRARADAHGGGQAAVAGPVSDQVGEEVPQDRAVAVPIDVGDEGFHGLAAGVVALDQLDADEASGKGRQGDVGTDPVHGGHAGSAGLRLD